MYIISAAHYSAPMALLFAKGGKAYTFTIAEDTRAGRRGALEIIIRPRMKILGAVNALRARARAPAMIVKGKPGASLNHLYSYVRHP